MREVRPADAQYGKLLDALRQLRKAHRGDIRGKSPARHREKRVHVHAAKLRRQDLSRRRQHNRASEWHAARARGTTAVAVARKGAKIRVALVRWRVSNPRHGAFLKYCHECEINPEISRPETTGFCVLFHGFVQTRENFLALIALTLAFEKLFSSDWRTQGNQNTVARRFTCEISFLANE